MKELLQSQTRLMERIEYLYKRYHESQSPALKLRLLQDIKRLKQGLLN
jgi:hypothetical protein